MYCRDLSVRRRFDDAELNGLLSPFRSDRCDGAFFVVKPNELAEIQSREQVAIQNEQRAILTRQPSDRTGSSERRRFVGVGEFDAPILSFLEVRLDQSCKVSDGERDLSESLLRSCRRRISRIG